jgi:hypothetical protein
MYRAGNVVSAPQNTKCFHRLRVGSMWITLPHPPGTGISLSRLGALMTEASDDILAEGKPIWSSWGAVADRISSRNLTLVMWRTSSAAWPATRAASSATLTRRTRIFLHANRLLVREPYTASLRPTAEKVLVVGGGLGGWKRDCALTERAHPIWRSQRRVRRSVSSGWGRPPQRKKCAKRPSLA